MEKDQEHSGLWGADRKGGRGKDTRRKTAQGKQATEVDRAKSKVGLKEKRTGGRTNEGRTREKRQWGKRGENGKCGLERCQKWHVEWRRATRSKSMCQRMIK